MSTTATVKRLSLPSLCHGTGSCSVTCGSLGESQEALKKRQERVSKIWGDVHAHLVPLDAKRVVIHLSKLVVSYTDKAGQVVYKDLKGSGIDEQVVKDLNSSLSKVWGSLRSGGMDSTSNRAQAGIVPLVFSRNLGLRLVTPGEFFSGAVFKNTMQEDEKGKQKARERIEVSYGILQDLLKNPALASFKAELADMDRYAYFAAVSLGHLDSLDAASEITRALLNDRKIRKSERGKFYAEEVGDLVLSSRAQWQQRLDELNQTREVIVKGGIAQKTQERSAQRTSIEQFMSQIALKFLTGARFTKVEIADAVRQGFTALGREIPSEEIVGAFTDAVMNGVNQMR